MSGRKPFRAVPLKPGSRRRRAAPRPVAHYVAMAVVAGVAMGAASLGISSNGGADLASIANKVGVATGVMRARAPQAGDYWTRCAEARAAGTAPIYAGEPGYREGLDGDSDGIACEPYRGQ